MSEIKINDILINFPHENPYTVQRTYMEKVIECLRDSKNGVLESPTGTGKTLSLLCSSLAWLKREKEEITAAAEEVQRNVQTVMNLELDELPDDSLTTPVPKIVYASRTHTQLTQVIKELKGTSYSHMKVAVLASRNQLCIHPDLASETNANQTEMCKSKIKRMQSADSRNQCNSNDKSDYKCQCLFYERYTSLKGNKEFRKTIDDKILDVEDLVTAGRAKKFCPYYMSKELVADADIVFMPYNYLLDPKIRNFIKVDLNDAVIILDEAHNVPQSCEDAASIEFKSSQIVAAIQEVELIAGLPDNGTTKTFREFEVNALTGILTRLKNAVNEIEILNSLSAKEFDGDFIFTLMDEADIGSHTARNISLLIGNMLGYLSDYIEKSKSQPVLSQTALSQTASSQPASSQPASSQPASSLPKISRRSPGLRKFNEILWTVFADCGEEYRDNIKKHYRVHVVLETPSNLQSKVINFWCFSPMFSLQFLLRRKHVRSIIFTSGTVSPLDSFIKSLGIPIEVRLQNGHIIDQSQVLVEVISNGPDGELLLSNYKNRSDRKYLHSLGSSIITLSTVIPDGLLIFFPSYEILNLCSNSWQASGIWNQIKQSKPIFVEPKIKDMFANTMKNFYQQINDPGKKGAIFMAVCRGKVSEGLDFADINGRAVIITGLPYPPLWDPKIRLRRKYMQSNYTAGNESLSGDQWYNLEASRAVNQAIGRVIRHRNDYGAILLCDHRFNQITQKRQLSLWIQRHLKNEDSTKSFDSTINSISQFFQVQQSSFKINGSSSVPLENQNQTPPRRLNQTTITDVVGRSQLMTSNQITGSSPDSPNTDCINRQSMTSNRIMGLSPYSPMTACINGISLLPLSSPSPSTSSANVHNNETPSKRKCSVNLNQRFDEQN